MILSKHVHFTIGVHLGFFGVFVFVFSVVFFFPLQIMLQMKALRSFRDVHSYLCGFLSGHGMFGS